LVLAEKLEFDDDEKQFKYEEISFTEIHKEVYELKVFIHNTFFSFFTFVLVVTAR
jgi:hypothetical protein